MFYLLLLFVITISVLVLLYNYHPQTKQYLNRKCHELIVNFIIIIWSVLIGAIVASRINSDTNKNIAITNYRSMLNSCKQMNQHYMDYVKDIIDSLNINSTNLSQMNSLIKNIDQPFLFEELLRKSELYNCASVDFKNWLPANISFFQVTDWTISNENIETYKFNYQYLSYVRDMISNEELFINNDLSEMQLRMENYFLRKTLNDSTYNINTNDIATEYIKTYLNDSTTVEEKLFEDNSDNKSF